MDHYITDKKGIRHKITENGWDDTHAFVTLDNYRSMRLKMYYRHERTWDDHMGNTPCGYFVKVPITSRETRRVYLNFR